MPNENMMQQPGDYYTPQQMEAIKGYITALRNQKNPGTHWSFGLQSGVNSILSALLANKLGDMEKQNLGYQSKNLPSFGEPGSQGFDTTPAASPPMAAPQDTATRTNPEVGGMGGPELPFPISTRGSGAEPPSGSRKSVAEAAPSSEEAAGDGFLTKYPSLAPALDYIKAKEDFTPVAKWDFKQYSGGYGTRAEPGEVFTKEKAEKRLQGEALKVYDSLMSNLKVPLTEGQIAGLMSFGYNLGTGKGGLSDLMPYINAKDFTGAADKMLAYNRAGGKVNENLVGRRAEEAKLVRGESDPMSLIKGSMRPQRGARPGAALAMKAAYEGAPEAAFAAEALENKAPGLLTAETTAPEPDKGYEGAPERLLSGLTTGVPAPGMVTAEPKRMQIEKMTGAPSIYGALKGIGGAPRGPQQALMRAIAGETTGGAPGMAQPAPPQAAPARLAQAAPQPPAGAGGFIPPVPGLPPLPTDAQIRSLWGTGDPAAREMAVKMMEMKREALKQERIVDPYSGDVYVGNQYTGYRKSGLPGTPQFEKIPEEVAGVKSTAYKRLVKTPQGPALQAVPMLPAPGAQAAPAMGAPGAAEDELGPLPDTIEGKAQWAAKLASKKKREEELARKTADVVISPVAEAIKQGAGSQKTIDMLDTMEDAYRSAGDSVSGGPYGPQLLKLKSAIHELTGFDFEGLSEAQVIDKISTQLAFAATRELSARPAAIEVQYQLDANPGLRVSNKTAMYMIDLMRQESRNRQELGKLAATVGAKNPEKWQEIRQKYLDDHPIISPFTHKPLATRADARADFAILKQTQEPGKPDLTSLPMLKDPADISKMGLQGGQKFRFLGKDGKLHIGTVPGGAP